MNNKSAVIPILATLMLFSIISLSSACSCINLENTEDKLENAAYAFTGEVVDIQTSASYANQEMQEVTVKIIDYWKPSNFPEPVSLKLYATKDTGANCGYNFIKGEKYIIYAYSDAETGKMYTNSCMGNSLLSKSQEEIKELNKLTNSTSNDPPVVEPIESNVFTKFFNWIKKIFS